MPRKILLSGSQKRQAAKITKEKNEGVLAKMPKLTSFFATRSSTHLIQSDSNNTTNDGDNISENDDKIPSDDDEIPSGGDETSSDDDKIPRDGGEHGIIKFPSDPALWFPITEATIEYWVAKDSGQCRNKSECDSYAMSKRIYQDGDANKYRYFSNKMFISVQKNGEEALRKWMLYSPSKGSVYCFACLLFGSRQHENQFCQADGFCDWKNAATRITSHEQSSAHRESVLKLQSRKLQAGQIESFVDSHILERVQYWRKVLHRVVRVVLFLGERGLAFRGGEEVVGSAHNGNFLGCIELISHFDPFLAQHINDFGSTGKGKPSYLSKTIFEEFIHILAEEVRNVIVSEMQDAKYYSLSVDSTPDLTHTDQLTFITRYVHQGIPVERFLSFLQISSHKAVHLLEAILSYLDRCNIDIMHCRSQSYDNASNMSGCYTGTAARLTEINPLAVFVPCAGHSLNLVGKNSVDCCVHAVSFFGFIQTLYTFFSASTHRWGIFLKHIKQKEDVGLTLKNLCDTRWSAHASATKAVHMSYLDINEALDEIAEDGDQTAKTRHEAGALSMSMQTLEIAFLCVLWDAVLQRFDQTNKILQSEDVDIALATDLLNSLTKFLSNMRSEESFNRFEDTAKELSGVHTYRGEATRRRRRNKIHDYFPTEATDVGLSPREEFRTQTYFVILDKLMSCLADRAAKYKLVFDRFLCIINADILSYSEIQAESKKLAQAYSSDLDGELLGDEMMQFVSFAKNKVDLKCTCKTTCNRAHRPTPASYMKLLHQNNLEDAFPNVSVALRMFLSIMVTVCSGERSFSKLALIKNHLRSTMVDQRLSDLAILSIESNVLKKVDIDDIIDKFANSKSRKRKL